VWKYIATDFMAETHAACKF